MPVLSVAPNNPSLDIPVDEEILPVPATRATLDAAGLPTISEAEGRDGDPASPPVSNGVPPVQPSLAKASPAAAQDIPSQDMSKPQLRAKPENSAHPQIQPSDVSSASSIHHADLVREEQRTHNQLRDQKAELSEIQQQRLEIERQLSKLRANAANV